MKVLFGVLQFVDPLGHQLIIIIQNVHDIDIVNPLYNHALGDQFFYDTKELWFKCV